MKPEHSSDRTLERAAIARRLLAGFALAICCLALSGCDLLYNEFTFLDVSAPPPVEPIDDVTGS